MYWLRKFIAECFTCNNNTHNQCVGRQFTGPKALYLHRTRWAKVRSGDEDPPGYCSECNAEVRGGVNIRDRFHMQVHMLKHHGDRLRRCEFCELTHERGSIWISSCPFDLFLRVRESTSRDERVSKHVFFYKEYQKEAAIFLKYYAGFLGDWYDIINCELYQDLAAGRFDVTKNYRSESPQQIDSTLHNLQTEQVRAVHDRSALVQLGVLLAFVACSYAPRNF